MKRREFLQGAATVAAVAAVPVVAVAKNPGLRGDVGMVVVLDRELSESEVRRVSHIVLHQTAHGSQWNRAPCIGVPVEVPYHFVVSRAGHNYRIT